MDDLRPMDDSRPPSAAGSPWLYLRIHVQDLDDIPELLSGNVFCWINENSAIVEQWFYLQYVDHTGPHLRLRVRLQPTHFWAARAELIRLLGRGYVVVERTYVPEYGKFGGPAGVALAERIAQLGSTTAATVLRHRGAVDRLAVGAAHTSALVDGLDEGQRSSFLYFYSWYWSGRGRLGPMWAQTVRRIAADGHGHREAVARLSDAVRRGLAHDAVGPAITGYVDSFWSFVRSADPSRWGHSEWLTAFQHLHLQNNRLGVLPAEEAYLARLLHDARQLTAAV